jgi:signal transduction histidine kinase
MIKRITPTSKTNYLWLSMTFSVIFPMLLGIILSSYISDWRWIHYPFHSMVESVGSLSALIIATLMILMVNNNHLPRYYIWVACALIGMGVLDGFHAVLHAGTSFVWLHSVATMIGGLIFMAIWLPESWLNAKHQKTLLISVITITILISLFSIFFKNQLPTMVIQGEFSILAKVLNISGGVGFLVGSAYFIHHQLKNKNNIHSTDFHRNEDIVFANHSLLFGIAGMLFESSIIWDAGWWWWHILRLAAYLVVLIYFLTLFKRQQDLLSSNEVKLNSINKYLEQRVYERTKELEKANQAKSEFLSSMSHELRTPMNAILGFSQLLDLDEELQSNHKDSVNEILLAGNHLLELINEILDLAKIEEGRLNVKIENINISAVITESIITLSPLTQKNNIQIINNILPGTNYTVAVDKLRFKQVVFNLLSNAIKYNIKDGIVFIDVKVIKNSTIRISFKDAGPGIAKEKQEKLFIPFERLGYKGDVVEGAGIGLVLSKKLMELMNGEIGMYNNTTKGCTFYIEFPCIH